MFYKGLEHFFGRKTHSRVAYGVRFALMVCWFEIRGRIIAAAA